MSDSQKTNLLYKKLDFQINLYIALTVYKMKDFKQSKEALNKELEQFISILDELLPRYSLLLRKKEISKEELTELGEVEHYLIEVNAKITAIKNMLEQDLFGHSLDIYYKLKEKAKNGDAVAKAKLDRMRDSFEESIKGGMLYNWN